MNFFSCLATKIKNKVFLLIPITEAFITIFFISIILRYFVIFLILIISEGVTLSLSKIIKSSSSADKNLPFGAENII